MITLTCDYCGSQFERCHSYHKFLVKKGVKGIFCSRACKQVSQRMDLPISDIINRYQAGESTIEIGKSLNVSGTTIRNHLKRAGIELRSRTWHLNTDKNPTKANGHSERTKQLLRKHAIEQFKTKEAREMARHNQLAAIADGKIEKTSALENIVADLLDDMDISYTRQKPLRDPKTGRFFACVDFLLEDGTVLEVNGSFWHADPRLFPSGPEHACQQKTLDNDKRRKQKMKDLNIPLIEIWGLDVRENLDKVRLTIASR